MERQQFVVEMHDASYNTKLLKHRLLEKILHLMHSTYFQLKQKPECHFLNLYLYQRYWYMTYIQQCRPNYMRLQFRHGSMTKHKWRRIHLGKMVAIAASGFQGNGVEILPHRSVAIMMAPVSAFIVVVRPSKCDLSIIPGCVTFRPDHRAFLASKYLKNCFQNFLLFVLRLLADTGQGYESPKSLSGKPYY